MAISQLNITGRLMDTDNAPLSFSEVVLRNASGVLIEGTISEFNGEFSLFVIAGEYTLSVNYFSQNVYTKEISLTESIDYGVIIIDKGLILDEVSITDKKPILDQRGDRLIFNVKNSFMATGYNAGELLRRIPKLDPSTETPSIIGKDRVEILVDGKILKLEGESLIGYLASLPSENIKNIEVLTSPSAEFDAEGNSGLINIVLDKVTEIGFDGSISSNLKRRVKSGLPGITGNLNLKYSTDRLKLKGNFYGSVTQYDATRTSDIDYNQSQRNSQAVQEQRRDFYSGNIGVEYDVSSNINIGVLVDKGFSDNETTVEGGADFINENTLFRRQELPSNTTSQNDKFLFSGYADFNLDTSGRVLNINYSSVRSVNDRLAINSSATYSVDSNELLDQTASLNDFDGTYEAKSIQVDFVLPISKTKIKAGSKYSDLANSSEINIFNSLPNPPVLDPNQSNSFLYSEKISALYIQGDRILSDKISIKGGLRFEHTKTSGRSLTTLEVTDREFSNLFPSVTLSFYAAQNSSFYLSANRRISRPRFNEVNPFRSYGDSFSYVEGNPLLNPSFSNNYQLSYTYKNMNTSISYTKLTDGTDAITISEAGDPLIKSTIFNYINGTSIAMDFSVQYSLFENMSNSFYINGNYNKTESQFPELTIERTSGFGSFMSLNNSYSFGKNKKSAIALYFDIRPGGTDKFFKTRTKSYTSLQYRTKFLQDKLNVSIRISDIFRADVSDYTVQFADFSRRGNNYQDVQSISLAISYSFGNKKSKRISRKVDKPNSKRF